MSNRPARVRATEAATMLGLSPRGVQAMAARGDLPGAAKIGTLWTFDPDKLRRFIEARESECAARAALAIAEPVIAESMRETFKEPVTYLIRAPGCVTGETESLFECAVAKARGMAPGTAIVELYEIPDSIRSLPLTGEGE